ncbi:hypothetical protein HW115_16560 [Verrucomicrobiaceae bacterium N1E253]|uniref:SnoaL-like domain-containing protein n=1 Tax=Oceaniferula marina TaxID=2748318 RepID=A0A851GIR5_9BACT|nr:hypothetical protein [Oceaniferula marina]NWK57236.1 hypothetical protein [Oceaniferula marina]
MTKSNFIIAAVFATVVAVLLWWFSDTQVIKRKTHALAETASVARADGKGARALKTKDLAGLLSNEVIGSVEVSRLSDSFSKDEMLSAHHMLVHNCRSASAIFSDMEIEIDDETGTSATVTASLDLLVTDTRGEEYKESCLASLTWKKNDQDQWSLHRIQIHQQ